MQSVINLLRSGMTRNLGRITDPKLYRRSFTGTKHLIADYILQVCHVISDLSRLPAVTNQLLLAPGQGQGGGGGVVLADDGAALHNRALALGVMQGRIRFQSRTQKRVIFQHMQQSFGRTTLVLQGGSMFGLCHLGVAKALFLRGLLPRVITGSGAGALVAALLGIHTDDELPALLDGRGINLDAFERGEGGAAAAAPSWWSRWATVRRRLLRLLREGHVLDVKVLERLVRDNAGELTFDEAHKRTGRILNITVVAGAKGEVPTVLNYITAPNVVRILPYSHSANLPTLTLPPRLYSPSLCSSLTGWPD